MAAPETPTACEQAWVDRLVVTEVPHRTITNLNQAAPAIDAMVISRLVNPAAGGETSLPGTSTEPTTSQAISGTVAPDVDVVARTSGRASEAVLAFRPERFTAEAWAMFDGSVDCLIATP